MQTLRRKMQTLRVSPSLAADLVQMTPSAPAYMGRHYLCTTTPSAPPTASPPTPTPSSTPVASTDTSASSATDTDTSSTDVSQSDRIHSTDIAFKPNSAGWGYSKGYAKGFDSIFQKKKDIENDTNTTLRCKHDNQESSQIQSDDEVTDYLLKFEFLSDPNKKVILSTLLQKYPHFRE